MSESRSEVIAAELRALRQAADASALMEVQSLYPELVRLSIAKTPYKRLTMSVRFTEVYPQESLAVELTSSVLPVPLLSKLSRALENEAKARAGSPQLVATVELASRLVEQNLLLGCWDEIQEIKEELAPAALKLGEKSGKVTVTLCKEGHTIALELVIPDGYPAAAPSLRILECTLPTELASMLTLQANELLRRMCEGSSSAVALRAERDLLAPPASVRKRLEDARRGRREVTVDLSVKATLTPIPSLRLVFFPICHTPLC